MINWDEITFVARPDTWYDEATTVKLDGDFIDKRNTSSYFRGMKDGEDDGEICPIFEFDWTDENGNIINSNIPDIDHIVEIDDYIVKDGETGKYYNWDLNKEIDYEK